MRAVAAAAVTRLAQDAVRPAVFSSSAISIGIVVQVTRPIPTYSMVSTICPGGDIAAFNLSHGPVSLISVSRTRDAVQL